MTSATSFEHRSAIASLALAAVLLLGGSSAALAQSFTQSGANSTSPVNLLPFVGSPTFLDFTGNQVNIGNSAPGSFAALAGAVLLADGLTIASGEHAVGSVNFSGAGTRVELGGGPVNRLVVGHWGIGSLVVSGGALLDATVNAAACAAPGGACYNSIGAIAGSTATMTITGAGSEVRTLRNFLVGSTAVYRPPLENFTWGTPGGTTTAVINVLAGGTLRTESSRVAVGPETPSAQGNEQAFGNVVVDGVGSRWILTHDSIGNLFGAGLQLGVHATAQGNVTIRNGGKLLIDGSGGPGPNVTINIASDGGRGTLTVTGVGSSVDMVGKNTILNVGQSGAAAQGSFSVLAGATASALYTWVGRNLASGTIVIDGAGSLLSQVGVGTNQSVDINGGPIGMIGADGGNGQVTVSNGGRWLLSDGGGDDRIAAFGPVIQLGRGVGSTGGLTITGANSRVELIASSLNPGAGVGDNYNPFMAVGRESGSTGQLTVSNGGKLLLTGNAISTLTDSRSTRLNIGGYNDVLGGRQGTATVTGAGSEIIVTGMDSLINVGRGPASNGTLSVLNQGRVGATSIVVGAFGTGTVNVDNATLAFSGVRANPATGAGGTIGRGAGGSGTLALSNAAQVTIESNILAGGLNIGGDSFASGGSGIVSLTGGSSLVVSGSAANNGINVGRNGSGVLSLAGASTVSVAGKNIVVGSEAGGFGLLSMTGNSTLNAGYIGLAIRQGVETGGIATMIVNNSTVNVGTLEIGLLGFLGGNNSTINGTVIAHGTVSPGESPGRLIINGRINTGSGLLLLDVESNGAGGFNIDNLILTQGSTFDFNGMAVRFNFIGDTNPNAFAASGGMDLDNFLLSLNEDDQLSALSTQFETGVTWGTWFASSQFSATSDSYNVSDFHFDPVSGEITFDATVPEPASLVLAMLGLLGAAVASRRRAALCSPLARGKAGMGVENLHAR